MKINKLVGISIIIVLLLSILYPILNAEEKMTESFYDFSLKTIDGDIISLDKYRGFVVLIVNTASKCGFTKQYEGLEQLHQRFYEDGLRVLAFPSNDFLGQEPGTDEQIKQFCTTKYQVSFDLFSKINVKGKKQHPLFKYLTSREGFKGKITWNFNKFLIDSNGELIHRFGTRIDPLNDKIVNSTRNVLSNGKN